MDDLNTDLTAVVAYINTYALLPHGGTIIVGLSGGADSVFLLYALYMLRSTYNIQVIAAHFNHEWRGQAADRDEEFCKDLAQKLDIPFVRSSMSMLKNNITYNGSKEAIGRAARRTFFASAYTEYNADAVALAHHASDQIETFLIRLIRGASLLVLLL